MKKIQESRGLIDQSMTKMVSQMSNVIVVERMKSGLYKGVFEDKEAFGFTRMEVFSQLFMFIKIK